MAPRPLGAGRGRRRTAPVHAAPRGRRPHEIPAGSPAPPGPGEKAGQHDAARDRATVVRVVSLHVPPANPNTSARRFRDPSPPATPRETHVLRALVRPRRPATGCATRATPLAKPAAILWPGTAPVP